MGNVGNTKISQDLTILNAKKVLILTRANNFLPTADLKNQQLSKIQFWKLNSKSVSLLKYVSGKEWRVDLRNQKSWAQASISRSFFAWDFCATRCDLD